MNHSRPFLIIAHRGASGHEPENTLRSFEAAIKLGADMIELDVQACKTGELVVIHDVTVDRTTNGRGRVDEIPLSGLRKLNAGKGEQIPTVIEALNLIDERVSVNIELKTFGTAKPVADIVTQYLKNGWSNNAFLVSSFIHQELTAFHGVQPDIRLGALITGIPIDYAKFAADLSAWSVHASVEFINQAFVDDAHQRGLKFLVYTVNDEREISNMRTLGVDGIFTNFPNQARSTKK